MRTTIVMHRLSALIAGTMIAGCGSGTCDPGEGAICTVAGLGTAGFSGDGQSARDAEIYLPMDISIAPDGNLYIVDWNNHRIRRVDADGVMSTIAGTGLLGDGPPGPALEADFNHPTNLAFDAQGRMWIAAWHNSRIRMVDLATNTLNDMCGTGARAYAGDGGPAETAILDLPAAIEFAPAGDLVIVDQANQVIRRIDPAGMIHRVAGQCLVDTCAEGQTPTQCPNSDKFACDPAMCATPCKGGFGGDGGPALQARFNLPFGQSAPPAGRLAIDADGNMFLADTQNHRIRRIGTDGMVTTIAGTGTGGYSGDGGPATAAQLRAPVDLEFGADGTLYVADTDNSCIRAIAPSGVISTIAGVCGDRDYGGDDGPANEALLDRPYGIEVHDGLLYIADTHNHRVRVVNLP